MLGCIVMYIMVIVDPSILALEVYSGLWHLFHYKTFDLFLTFDSTVFHLPQFSGYDTGNHMIHVSGITTTLFPSDGGRIKTERTEFVQGRGLFVYHICQIF